MLINIWAIAIKDLSFLQDYFKKNFYSIDYFSTNLFLDFIPEILLVFFLLYGIVALFNDVENTVFQYYR
jgi:hypothetical protein